MLLDDLISYKLREWLRQPAPFNPCDHPPQARNVNRLSLAIFKVQPDYNNEPTAIAMQVYFAYLLFSFSAYL